MMKTSKSRSSVGPLNGRWIETKAKELGYFVATYPTPTVVQSYFMNARCINDYKRVACGRIFKQARLADRMTKLNAAI
jgi:hypothetical protein